MDIETIAREAVILLRELHDLQNGPPLIQYESDFHKVMTEISDNLRKWEERLGIE